jgi:hypothetical protein
MLRYLFGAYEPLDEALSVLRTPGLVIRRKRGVPGRTTQHDYYLTECGRDVASVCPRCVPQLVANVPVFTSRAQRKARPCRLKGRSPPRSWKLRRKRTR